MRFRAPGLIVAVVVTALLVLKSLGVPPLGAVARTGTQAIGADPGRWTSIGPSPMGAFGIVDPRNNTTGRVIAVAVDPVDPKHWLVGGASGGLWESGDAGTTWTSKNDYFPSLAIGKVAFAPSNRGIIYAATGEGNFSRDGLGGVGILKTTDSGATWQLLGASSFARAGVVGLRVHPTNPDIVVAITTRAAQGRFSEPASLPPPFGLQKSVDGGVSWSLRLAGQATSLAIDSTNFSNQYAAIGDVAPSTADSPGRLANGLYRSTDAGQSWSPIGGPWGVSTLSASTTGKIIMALAPSNPDVLYVSVQAPPNAQRLLGLYRTDNAWASAPTFIKVPTDATGADGYCSRQCGSAHSLSVAPSDPNTVFAGGLELWRCRNCGPSPTWTNIGMTPVPALHPDHRILAWEGNRLIDGSDGGVKSTTDEGDSWQNHNATLSVGQLFSGDLHPSKPDFMLAGSKDNGCLIRTAGLFWGYLLVPQHGVCEGDVAISSLRPDTDWMASSDFGQVSRTTNGGKSFEAANAGISEAQASITPAVRKCPNNDDVMLTGNNQLWRTSDFFSAQTAAWFANGPSGAGALSVRGIAFAPSDKSCNTYAFGTTTGRLWITVDGGRSWRDLDPNRSIPARAVNSLAFSPRLAGTVFVALSGYDESTPGRPGHVFKTVNADGVSPAWSNVSPPDNRPQNVVAVDPVDVTIVYVGAEAGVWFGTNEGGAWTHSGPDQGMPNVPVYDLKIHPMTGQLVAFTFGRGAYVMSPTRAAP